MIAMIMMTVMVIMMIIDLIHWFIGDDNDRLIMMIMKMIMITIDDYDYNDHLLFYLERLRSFLGCHSTRLLTCGRWDASLRSFSLAGHCTQALVNTIRYVSCRVLLKNPFLKFAFKKIIFFI